MFSTVGSILVIYIFRVVKRIPTFPAVRVVRQQFAFVLCPSAYVVLGTE
jgi:hypothetical protein